MGIFNGGGAALIQSVASKHYMPGTVFAIENVYDQWGDITQVETQYDIQCQVDDMTEAMRREAGAAEQDRRIIVLTNTNAPMNTDCEITTTQPGFEGWRFQIASVATDSVYSHWILRGRRAS